MSLHRLCRQLRGPFNFLRPQAPEIERLVPDAERVLPRPQKVFLDDEAATPLEGFPVLADNRMAILLEGLESYVRAEEIAEVARIRRTAFDAQTLLTAWQTYRRPLALALTNATTASHGRQFPEVFWLVHSLSVARTFKESTRRILKIDVALGRSSGDQVKYRVFHRWLDRVLQVSHEVARRSADQVEGLEGDQFPQLLRCMADNVLIFTEEHVSQDLAEIASYLRGHLEVDPKDLLGRLRALRTWHREEIERSDELRAVAATLLGAGDPPDADDLLHRPGYATFLSRRRGYDTRRLLDSEAIALWERLLEKLQEFEVFLGLRRRILPVAEVEGHPISRDPGLSWAGPGRSDLALSNATRPFDFFHEWVVEPVVERFGMIYDLTSFTEVVSQLRRRGSEEQDRAFRHAFDFQRWIDRQARGHRLRLEKYLGDGALYSGRHPTRLLLVAVLLQRHYRKAIEVGFPFDRGMRIALNYGSYRLLPVGGDDPGEEHRYEFLGHGIVELSRLVTGKATREIEEVKNLLVHRGYPERTVDRFFAPLAHQNLDLVDPGQQRRTFFAYINPYGALVNEGIVATQDFVVELERTGRLGVLRQGLQDGRAYIVHDIEEDGLVVRVGMRKLGLAEFKGLGRLPVFELVDGDGWGDADLLPLPNGRLSVVLERQFHRPVDKPRPSTPPRG